MRTYLVTGGAGFIGSNYIHYMFRKYDNEIRIINVDKLTYAGNLENLKDIEDRENYTFVKADICDSEAINRIFDENDIDRVVHFAAESHVDRSIRNPEVFVKTNVLGTLVMLNAAKAAWELPDGTFKPDKKFLHVSTDEVYGSLENEDEFFYETTPYDPHSPYSASKASSDMLVKSYMDTYKFPANITNCSNNYGPYQFPEKLIPLIINNALQGKKLPVYGDGKNVRDWLYVEDHAKGIDMVQEKGRLFETYNIGGHNEKQNIQIIHIILDTLQEMLPEGDPRKELVEQLLQYKMYKYMAYELKDRQSDAEQVLFKQPTVPEEVLAYTEPVDLDALLDGLTLSKLNQIFQDVMKRQDNKIDPVRSKFGKIEKEEVPLPSKMTYVENYAREHRHFSFRQLLEEQSSKMHVVVTFLAILELMKTGAIRVAQEETFGEIMIDSLIEE